MLSQRAGLAAPRKGSRRASENPENMFGSSPGNRGRAVRPLPPPPAAGGDATPHCSSSMPIQHSP
jgi:hypothetical protein